MGPLALLLGAGLGWAWLTGRLKRFLFEDVVAAVAALTGLHLLAGGQLLLPLALIGGAAFWAGKRLHEQRDVEPMTAEDARAVLGVTPAASAFEISLAHRRLITRVHPDRGGSAELAARVNLARDTLMDELREQPSLSR